ncbi:Uma2 family endonuclease [bacterium]|nr:MAG: Uma2 family endonuclease [bacterium]
MALPRSLIPLNAERVSPEEYLRREAEAEFKSEYYDGYIVPLWPQGPNGMAGGSAAHGVLCTNLILALGASVRSSGCQLFSSEIRVQRSDAHAHVYPDASVACHPEWASQTHGALANPRIVFEVLLPSTERHDRTTKFAIYSAIPSIEAIVLVSSDLRLVEVYSRHSATAWLREAYESGNVVLPGGITLDLAELYAQVPELD